MSPTGQLAQLSRAVPENEDPHEDSTAPSRTSSRPNSHSISPPVAPRPTHRYLTSDNGEAHSFTASYTLDLGTYHLVAVMRCKSATPDAPARY